MIDYIVFLSYKLFKLIILALPKTFVKLFLDIFVNIAYFIDKEHKQYAFANLDFVYQDKLSYKEKKEIVKGSYKTLVYNLYELIENQTLDLKGFEEKITVKNEQVILDAIKNNRKIILITAHYGNWEYGNTFIPLKYKPTTMVGRPMNNKYFNEELDKTRTKNNTQMLKKKDAARGLVKALKNDRIVGLVVDQHNRTGIEIDFFGKKVLQTDSAAKLAIKFDAVILPLFFQRTAFNKYDAIFYNPIEPKDYQGENQVKNLTQAQADIIQYQIELEPKQWFWQHKRFKKFHSEIYK